MGELTPEQKVAALERSHAELSATVGQLVELLKGASSSSPAPEPVKPEDTLLPHPCTRRKWVNACDFCGFGPDASCHQGFDPVAFGMVPAHASDVVKAAAAGKTRDVESNADLEKLSAQFGRYHGDGTKHTLKDGVFCVHCKRDQEETGRRVMRPSYDQLVAAVLQMQPDDLVLVKGWLGKNGFEELVKKAKASGG